MGDKAEDILAPTNTSEDDRKEYSQFIVQFDTFLRKMLFLKEPVLTAAVREKVSWWSNSSLYSLAKYCEYGGMKDETIHDRIVKEFVTDQISYNWM